MAAVTEAGVITLPQIEEVPNSGPGPKTIMVYVFEGEQGKRDSIVVIAQLSPEFTAALVDRVGAAWVSSYWLKQKTAPTLSR